MPILRHAARSRSIHARRIASGRCTLVAALVAGALAAPAPAFAANGDPFDTTRGVVFLSQSLDSDGETLYQQVQGTGSVVFEKVNATPAAIQYNGIGFRVKDGYIYGFSGATLVRVGQGGVVTSLGSVGLPSDAGINTGVFGDGAYADVMFIQGSGGVVYSINFATWNGSTANLPKAVTLTTNPSVPNCADAFFVQGYLWEACNALVWRIPPTGGATKSFSVPFLDGGGFGAQWTYGNGNIGVSRNDTGRVTQFSITDGGSDNPTFTLISTMTGPSASGNDGTAIPGADTDLALTKTTEPLYAPGGAVPYTLTVTNTSAYPASGYTITDTIPAGLTLGDLPAGCTFAAASRLLTCTGGRLPAGESATTVIPTVASESGTSCIDNTAKVFGNERDTVTANNTSTVRTCRMAGVKVAASVSPARVGAVGAEGQWTFLVTNNGDTPIEDVAVEVTAFSGSGELSQPVCAKAALAIDESTTCTVTAYPVSQADLDAGEVVATVVAHAATADGRALTSAPSSAALAVDQHPSLAVSVASPPYVATAPGELVWFEVTLTNTGNVTLSGVGVDEGQTSGTGDPVTVGECRYPDSATEPVAAAADPGDPGDPDPGAPRSGQLTIPPGGTAVCMVSYQATQEDFDAGGAITYPASISGLDPVDGPVTATAEVVQLSLVGLFDRPLESPWSEGLGVDILADVQNVPDGTVVTGVVAAPGDRSQDSWWSVDPETGEILFNPPPQFSGRANAVVTITYPGGTTGTQPVSVLVAPPDVSVAAASGTVPETRTLTLTPAITAPAGSDITASGDPAQGVWVVNPDRTVTFTPAPGFLGQATATLTVTAPDGTSQAAQLAAEVTMVPRLVDASASIAQGRSATLTPSLGVPDGSITRITGDPAQGAWMPLPDLSVVFVPVPGFTGEATATLTVTGPDGMVGTSRLRVLVTPAAVAADVAVTVPEDSAVTLRPVVQAPQGATAEVVGEPGRGVWALNDDLSVTFTPADGFLGDTTATFTLTAPNGTVSTATLTATVTMVPKAEDASQSVPQAQPATLRPEVRVPAGSRVSVVGDATQGVWMVNADYSVTFVPVAGFSGTAAATLTITGPDGLADTAQLTVEVTPVPVLSDASVSVPEGQPAVLRPAVAIPNGSAVQVVGDPAQGTWTRNLDDDTFTFTPVPGFTGTATATLTVVAPNGTIATANLQATITMTPAADDATATATPGQPVVLRPVAKAPTGSRVTVDGDPTQGVWMVNSDNSVTFVSVAGFTGTATATLTITSPDGLVDTARLTVDVTAPTTPTPTTPTPTPTTPTPTTPTPTPTTPTPTTPTTPAPTPISTPSLTSPPTPPPPTPAATPAVAHASASVPKDTPATLRPDITVPDGSTVTVVGDPAEGTWTLNTDYSVTFTPAPGFTGRATATITVVGPDGALATATLAADILDDEEPAEPEDPAPVDEPDPSSGPVGTGGSVAHPLGGVAIGLALALVGLAVALIARRRHRQ